MKYKVWCEKPKAKLSCIIINKDNVFITDAQHFAHLYAHTYLFLCRQQNLTLTFPHNETFWPLGNKPFENTVGKGEIARNEQFLLLPQCFLPLWRTFCHFHQTENYRLQTLWVWKSLKFVVWVRAVVLWLWYRTVIWRQSKSFNTFPHNDTFWHPWETRLLKTLWEKEKLLVTSNFSFSHSVFYLFG